MAFHVPNQFRVRKGLMASADENGNNGCFFVPNRVGRTAGGYSTRETTSTPLAVIASDGSIDDEGQAWEHVSVNLPTRCPTWDEMDFIKGLFWDDEDCVMQLHPPRSQWVNNHPFCLHLWRPVGVEIPQPPSIMVGVQSLGVLK